MKFLSLLFLFISTSTFAQIAVGLYAGLDQSKFSGDIPEEYIYDFKDGYVLGLTFDFAVGERMFISLRPNFTENGGDITLPDNFSVALPTYPFDTVYQYPITNKYVALPIIYQIYVSRAFYANAGLDVAYNLSSIASLPSGDEDLTDKMSEYLASAIFGFGFAIPIGRTSLNLEFSYGQSLNTLTKREEIDDGESPRLRVRRFRFAGYFTIFATKKTL